MCFPSEGFWQRKINDGIRRGGRVTVTEGFKRGGGKKKIAVDMMQWLFAFARLISFWCSLSPSTLPVCTLNKRYWSDSQGATSRVIQNHMPESTFSSQQDYAFEMYEEEVLVFNSLVQGCNIMAACCTVALCECKVLGEVFNSEI